MSWRFLLTASVECRVYYVTFLVTAKFSVIVLWCFFSGRKFISTDSFVNLVIYRKWLNNFQMVQSIGVNDSSWVSTMSRFSWVRFCEQRQRSWNKFPTTNWVNYVALSSSEFHFGGYLLKHVCGGVRRLWYRLLLILFQK